MTLVRVIRPPGSWPTLNIREVYLYRELIWVFVKRGIFTRYRQMALGITWSFLEPLGLLLLMSIVFGYLIQVPTEGYPFTVFVATALIPWMYFSKATNAAANSLHEQLGIISKIYFPRIIVPVSAVIREFFDSLVLFIIMMLLNLGFGYWPTWRIIMMPFLLLYITLPALGLGLAVSSISIKYRDFRPLLTIVLQAGFYATPVFYPAELVPARVMPIYQLNPMYWGVEFSRWMMLGKPLTVTPSLFFSIALSITVIIFGYYAFATYEREVVDAQ
jgi:homopolymeric O-antigen transport system permease protein